MQVFHLAGSLAIVFWRAVCVVCSDKTTRAIISVCQLSKMTTGTFKLDTFMLGDKEV